MTRDDETQPPAGPWQPYRLDSEWADAVAGVCPVLRETETEAEEQRMLPTRAFQALAEAGLFRLVLPKDVGGAEVDPLVEMQVYEAVSRTSASACWNLSAGCLYTSWAAAYLSDEAVEEIFAGAEQVVVAGQGPPRGSARTVPGGVRVSGRYSFGSGMSHATWVVGGFTMADEDGTGTADWQAFVVPKDQVDVHDNWHALGLAGSNSVDYSVDDLFVPHGYCFSISRPEPLRGGSRFAAPVAAQVAAAHCGVALGAAERALDEISAIARAGRESGSGAGLADRGAFQRDLGRAHTTLTAARDHAARLLDRLADLLALDVRVHGRFVRELVAAQTYTTEVAVDVVTMAYRYAGPSAVRLTHPLQRVLRDLLVAQQHKFVADTSYDALGRALVDDARLSA
jgi:alkylation response protein AidB-like acyl-CoA dehydrogenase